MQEFIEFAVSDDVRFGQLAAVFAHIRAAKLNDQWHDDAYWLAFFDAEARTHFWWPTEAERRAWADLWLATPVPQRFNDPALQTPWDFGSMIDAFRSGEYELIACERVSHEVGRLRFEPYGWPYGGTGCMKALVESFGHRLTIQPEV